MNSGLGNKKERAASHPEPIKSQVRTELHYYLVTFFWLADGFQRADLYGFQTLLTLQVIILQSKKCRV